RLAAGEEALTLAWQEQPGQLDAAASTATRWVDGLLNGAKLFVADPAADGTLLVLARDGAGAPLLAAVPANAPGLTLDRQAAGQGSLATVTFAQVPVTPDQVLARGEPALAAMDA